MSQGVAEALTFLKGLGTPADLAARLTAGHPPTAKQKVNSHIHLPPNFSAFQTVTQALELSLTALARPASSRFSAWRSSAWLTTW